MLEAAHENDIDLEGKHHHKLFVHFLNQKWYPFKIFNQDFLAIAPFFSL